MKRITIYTLGETIYIDDPEENTFSYLTMLDNNGPVFLPTQSGYVKVMGDKVVGYKVSEED